MESRSAPLAANGADDLEQARDYLVRALAILDASALPPAVTAATYVSYALELFSPGADPFDLESAGPPRRRRAAGRASASS